MKIWLRRQRFEKNNETNRIDDWNAKIGNQNKNAKSSARTKKRIQKKIKFNYFSFFVYRSPEVSDKFYKSKFDFQLKCTLERIKFSVWKM